MLFQIETERESINHFSLSQSSIPYPRAEDARDRSVVPWNGRAWQWCFMFIAIRSQFDLAEPPCFNTSTVLEQKLGGTSSNVKMSCELLLFPWVAVTEYPTSEVKVSSGRAPAESSRGESFLVSSTSGCPGVPWLVAASLPSLLCLHTAFFAGWLCL